MFNVFKYIHRCIIRRGVLGHGLHVGVDKAGNLQICFFQEDVSKRSHQTHWHLCFKQQDCGNHAELWVEILAHEKLNCYVLDLIHKECYLCNCSLQNWS